MAISVHEHRGNRRGDRDRVPARWRCDRRGRAGPARRRQRHGREPLGPGPHQGTRKGRLAAPLPGVLRCARPLRVEALLEVQDGLAERAVLRIVPEDVRGFFQLLLRALGPVAVGEGLGGVEELVHVLEGSRLDRAGANELVEVRAYDREARIPGQPRLVLRRQPDEVDLARRLDLVGRQLRARRQTPRVEAAGDLGAVDGAVVVVARPEAAEHEGVLLIGPRS